MKILVKAICKGCGKEFDPRSGTGKPRAYCSPKCRNARHNNAFREKQKEKKREYNHKYNRSLAERRSDEEKEE